MSNIDPDSDPRLLTLSSLYMAERYLRHPELVDIPFVIPPMVVAERVYRSFYLLWETLTEEEKSNYLNGGGEMIMPGTHDAYDADEAHRRRMVRRQLRREGITDDIRDWDLEELKGLAMSLDLIPFDACTLRLDRYTPCILEKGHDGECKFRENEVPDIVQAMEKKGSHDLKPIDKKYINADDL